MGTCKVKLLGHKLNIPVFLLHTAKLAPKRLQQSIISVGVFETWEGVNIIGILCKHVCVFVTKKYCNKNVNFLT